MGGWGKARRGKEEGRGNKGLRPKKGPRSTASAEGPHGTLQARIPPRLRSQRARNDVSRATIAQIQCGRRHRPRPANNPHNLTIETKPFGRTETPLAALKQTYSNNREPPNYDVKKLTSRNAGGGSLVGNLLEKRKHECITKGQNSEEHKVHMRKPQIMLTSRGQGIVKAVTSRCQVVSKWCGKLLRPDRPPGTVPKNCTTVPNALVLTPALDACNQRKTKQTKTTTTRTKKTTTATTTRTTAPGELKGQRPSTQGARCRYTAYIYHTYANDFVVFVYKSLVCDILTQH